MSALRNLVIINQSRGQVTTLIFLCSKSVIMVKRSTQSRYAFVVSNLQDRTYMAPCLARAIRTTLL